MDSFFFFFSSFVIVVVVIAVADFVFVLWGFFCCDPFSNSSAVGGDALGTFLPSLYTPYQ